MSAEFALALLGSMGLVLPVAVIVAVVVLLICIGKAAAGDRFRWPWTRKR